MFEFLKEIDTNILLRINEAHSPFLDTFFWWVSEGWVFVPLWLFLIFYIYKLKKLKFLLTGVLVIVLLIVCTDQSSTLVKKAVKRYRPTHNTEIGTHVHVVNDYRGGKFGFFSGHAANTFGVASFLIFMFAWVKPSLRFSLYLWPLLVGYSRIYLGVHYPSDVFFGFLDGLLWGYLGYMLFKYIYIKQNV